MTEPKKKRSYPFRFAKKMSQEEYRAHPAVSRSELFEMRKSPQYFNYAGTVRQVSSEAFIFGSAVHKYVLEPRVFCEEYYVLDHDLSRRSKQGKEEYAAALMAAGDKQILSTAQFIEICNIGEAIQGNNYASKLFRGGVAERSIFWTDTLSGIRCKIRPDYMRIVGDVVYIADLKTTRDVSLDGFSKKAVELGYTLQAAMYIEGVQAASKRKARFFFVAVEKEPPYLVNVMEADMLFIRYGQEQFREYIGMYRECSETGNWFGPQGFSGAIQTISLPPYLQKNYI